MSIDEIDLIKSTFDECGESIIIINEIGHIVKVNQATKRIFGYSPDEMIGESIQMLIPQEYKKSHPHRISGFLKDPVKRIMGQGKDLYGINKQGKKIPLEVGLSYLEKNGERFGIAFITDITIRKANQTKLVESEKRLEAIIKTAIDGICIINSKGNLEGVNNALCDIFGYTENELVGQNISLLILNDILIKQDQYLERYNHENTLGETREVMGKKKDGSKIPLRLSVSEFSQNGESYYTGVLHDITVEYETKNQLKKFNSELEQRVKERTQELADIVKKLEKINQELELAKNESAKALEKERELHELKSRFVSMASHEFRTPLSTILSSNSILQRYDVDQINPKKEKHYKRISSNVKNLTTILNDFLSLDKLESGVIECQKTSFNLKEMVGDIINDLTSLLKPKQQIVFKYEGDEEVQLDQNFTKNILINLLSNGIKYSLEEQYVELFISNDEELEIIVQDYGIGIPDEEQKYLFDRFFRAKNTTNIQGTGLGLNIVKKYVELMGGRISFKSELNKGTSFIVKF